MTAFEKVRVRIAPSPTGDPHVGTAYITLFNYVFAKQHGGTLILRLEDTDQKRAKSESEQQIYDSLRWLGLSWDEGPDVGGPFGPYRQSERREIHRQHAEQLVATGKAYRCFCTAERLDALRQSQRLEGGRPGYDGHCRELDNKQVAELMADGVPHVIRLKVPLEGTTAFEDALRGPIEINNSQLDDQVLLKSDGYPTYHLANVVDDHLMQVSHVIRAEEWISSTPKHVLLYQAFGWQLPVFAHMPLLRNADRSKISKRKNPVSLNYYRRKGILPAALLNYLGLMGWSFGEDREIFSIADMCERFKLKDIHLGGPVFDIPKLCHLNHKYLQALDAESFADYLCKEVFSKEYLKRLHPLLNERLEAFEQFVDKASFFFTGALPYSGLNLLPKGKQPQELCAMLTGLLEQLDELYSWTSANLHELMEAYRQGLGWKPKDYFMPIRLVVTGRQDSPPLAESMELVGREMVRFRIREALGFLESQH